MCDEVTMILDMEAELFYFGVNECPEAQAIDSGYIYVDALDYIDELMWH